MLIEVSVVSAHHRSRRRQEHQLPAEEEKSNESLPGAKQLHPPLPAFVRGMYEQLILFVANYLLSLKIASPEELKEGFCLVFQASAFNVTAFFACESVRLSLEGEIAGSPEFCYLLSFEQELARFLQEQKQRDEHVFFSRHSCAPTQPLCPLPESLEEGEEVEEVEEEEEVTAALEKEATP